ncbi:hypothetical protein QE364_001615 [Nocardioides zeae]|uniref:Uncharacterized protein n=1 Tax=Nocardioides zeae TaxID=1457234 RepID=A0ACC6IH30_9ACTN|nr:hypothetical protein [Nocardioides zeae]MDR6172914.1 hypothetical protein [Nocardioides zeae]MDR6209908.1 hypothetical protein [Nocardioides zeae]
MKKVILLLLVVFLGFWMFTDPQGLAATAREGGGGAWDALVSIFEATIRFLGALF